MKTLAFSVPIYKYKVQNWDIKKKKLLELFNNFQHKVVGGESKQIYIHPQKL